MAMIIQFLIGALSCLILILAARQAGMKREAIIYAVGLVVAALVYVGFAARGGVALSWLALESGGLVLFSSVALLGLRISMWFLMLGWAAHALWDVLLHKVLNVGFVPEWYPVMCLGFDLFLAGYIGMCVRGGRWVVASSLTSRSSRPESAGLSSGT
jgi:hypothetical protein